MSRPQVLFLAFIFAVGLTFTVWGSATNNRGWLAGGFVWLALFWFSLGRVERQIGEDDE